MQEICDIHPGDVVRILLWDEMLAVEGNYIERSGDIHITSDNIVFSRGMRGLCGRRLTVSHINCGHIYFVQEDQELLIREDVLMYTTAYWTITPGMVEVVPSGQIPAEDLCLALAAVCL